MVLPPSSATQSCKACATYTTAPPRAAAVQTCMLLGSSLRLAVWCPFSLALLCCCLWGSVG